MAMLLVLVVIVLIIYVVYVKLKYFTLRGPLPGKPPQLLFGNIVQMGTLRGVSQANINLQMQAKFGDVYQYWMGPFRIIGISNIEDIQHVFSYRHIYEPGKIRTEQLASLLGDSLITIIGQ